VIVSKDKQIVKISIVLLYYYTTVPLNENRCSWLKHCKDCWCTFQFPLVKMHFMKDPPQSEPAAYSIMLARAWQPIELSPRPFWKRKQNRVDILPKTRKKICRACVWKSMKKKIRKHDIVITFLSLPAIPYFFPLYIFPKSLRKKIIINQAMLDGFLLNKATITYFTQI